MIAPSAAMLASLEHDFGPFPSSEVIYNARNMQHFRPATKHQMIFSAGRLWDEAKNLAALDAVAPRLPWPVYVAGDSHHPAAAGGTEVTASPHVSFLGKLTERQVASRLGYASIYALPARYEPFGLSILEAALAGCTLVLGDIPSLREIWRDGAIFVSPNDHDALASALLRLINSPRDRAILAARSQFRAHEFTPERMADAYLRTYTRLVHSGKNATSLTAFSAARPRLEPADSLEAS
jgi:glycogen synthase